MRNKSVDGLKACLALLIIFFHYNCRFYQLYLGYDFWGFRYLGVIGGETFMLLSCYYLGKNENNFKLVPYLRKKFIRLYPAYFISITLIMVFLHILYLPGRTVSFKNYILNVLFVSGYIESSYVDSAHWYVFTLVSAIIVLGILKKFYIANKYVSYVGWLVIGYVVSKIGFKYTDILYNFLGGSYIGIICSGVSLRNIIEANDKEKNIINQLQWGIVILGGLLYTYIFKDLSSAFFLIPSLLIVYCVMKYELNFLQNKFLLTISSVSYSLYLIHQNIGYSIEYTLMINFGKKYLWLYGIVAFLVVVVLSFLIEYFVKRLNYKIVK